jgi:GT2 family glycosyltransferase
VGNCIFVKQRMEPHEKDIAVIIINYNSSDYTLDCVRSIFAQTNKELDYQLIIVDNASKPEDAIKLRGLESDSRIDVIYSKKNLGFGGGNMLGAGRSNARYLFFLNNDCILLNDCLRILADFCDRNPKTGLCGGQLYSEDHKPIGSFSYMPTPALKFLGPGLLKIFNPPKYPSRHKQHSNPVKVELVSGSGLFFRTDAFNEIGAFDLNLFFYCEEEDLGLRLEKARWDIYFVPEAKYIHFGGGSSSENLVMLKEYYISLMYLFRKHFSGVAYFFLKILYALKFLRKSLKNKRYFPFVGFILRGAPNQESLKYLSQN